MTLRTLLVPGLLVLAATAPGAVHGQAAPPGEGEGLARALGCGACHAGLPAPESARAAAPPLGPGAPPLPADFVFQYLADPRPRRPELAPARMPDFRLADDERLALALFLGSDAGAGLEQARALHPGVTADDGGLLFRGLGCAGCHGATTAPGTAVGPDLSTAGARYRPGWVERFLSAPVPVRPAGHAPGTGSRMPDFRLTPEEAAALAAYLATLGADAPEARAAAGAGGEPLTAWGRQRAERHLTDRLSCLGCHSWRGDGGRLAPPLDGLPQRLTPGAVAAMVHDPSETRPGSLMPPSPFRREILHPVAALLAGDTAAWVPAAVPTIPWTERRAFLGEAGREAGARPHLPLMGRDLYLATCAQCHGIRGDGGGFNAPHLPVVPTAHADAAAMSRRPDDTLHDGIASGGWVLDGSHRMPAFGGRLAPAQIRSLVAYIRELCACAGPGWSRGGAP